MRIMGKKSDRLENRYLTNSVCVECDCGEHLLWPIGGGNAVKCPTCKKTDILDVDGSLALPPPKVVDNPEDLPLLPAKPFPPIPEAGNG